MTAPKQAGTDPLAEQKERLRRAAQDLEDAASDALDAIADIAPDGVKTVLPDALAAAIARMHDAEHDGPMRWCKHPVCTEARLAGAA